MTLRWRIRGSFTTTAPMHVGSGANTEHSSIIVQNKAPCDVAAVVMDYQGHPCIPGTALKGVLRAWAEQFFPDESAAIVRIFGHQDVTAPTAESGWAEFTTAFIRTLTQTDLEQFEKRVPYWQPDRCTGIFSSVCISRKTGAAQANKLFYQEFVPEGVSFEVGDRRDTADGRGNHALAGRPRTWCQSSDSRLPVRCERRGRMGTSRLVAGLREPRFSHAGTRPGAGGSRL